MTNTTTWNFEPQVTKEVPLVRQSTSLPFNWQKLIDKADSLKADENTFIMVPLDFWIKDRKVPANEATTEKIKGRVKAAFTGWRANKEKDAEDLMPYTVVVVEVKDKDGNIEGHKIFATKADLELRQKQIAAAKNMQAKAKKRPAAKKAAKKKAS